MNRFLALIVLWNLIFVNANHNDVPSVQIKVMELGGFQVCIPDADGMVRFSFYGSINRSLQHLAKSPYKADVTTPTDGFWCFVNRQRQILNGDVLNYRYEVSTRTSHHLTNAVSFVFTDVHGSDMETTTKAQEIQAATTNSKSSGPFDFFLVFHSLRPTIFNTGDKIDELVIKLRNLIDPNTDNCTKLLDLSKKTIFDLISYNSDIERKYQDVKEDLATAKKSESKYKQMLVETFRIIELSHKNKSNTLRLESSFTMLDGYANHVISNELQLTEKDYSISGTRRLSNNATEFEVDTYGHKLNIFLTSRVKLKGTKVKFFDPDFE